VTAKGLAALKSLKSVRRLSFGKTPADATRDMAEVARLFPDVTEITPAPGPNSKADIEAIGLYFLKVTTINWGPNGLANPVLDDGCFEALGSMPHLVTIKAQKCTVTDEGLKLLSQLKSLANLSLAESPTLTDAAFDQIKLIKSLRSLDISRSHFTDAAIAAFNKARPDVKVTR
jgi:hypothetical protein